MTFAMLYEKILNLSLNLNLNLNLSLSLYFNFPILATTF